MFKKLREIIQRRRKYDGDAVRQIAGEDFNYWGQYLQEDREKLEDLCECLLYEMRVRTKLTQDQEEVARKAFKRLTNFIEICETVYKLDRKEASQTSMKDAIKDLI